MTPYQNKPVVPNERAMRDLITARYAKAHSHRDDLPTHARPSFITKLIRLVGEEDTRTEAGRKRVAATLWAVHCVVMNDLVSDEEV